MGRRVTEKEKLSTAYAIGKSRQSFSTAIALIFINILLVLITQPQQIGFNIAMFIICCVSAFSHNAAIKRLEKLSALTEEELVAGLN